MKRLVYALKCPFTDEVHYVGKSSRGIVCPSEHITNTHSEKIKMWVDSLRTIGSSPKIEVLEYVRVDEELDERERYYIKKYLSKGNILLNSNLYTSNLVTDKLNKHLEHNGKLNIDEISEFVKVRRKQVGLTQEQFAEKCGVALTVVRKIEQGNINVNLNGLLTVLSMFGHKLSIKRNKDE